MATAMDSSAQILVIAVILILAAVSLVWHSCRSRALLERWAARPGDRIIDADCRNVFRGPFFWTTKAQTVYRVTVEIQAGAVRRGWVLCGGRLLGLISDRAEVRWDEAPTKATGPMHDRWLDG